MTSKEFQQQLILSALQGLCANPFITELSQKAIEMLHKEALPGQLPETGNIYESIVSKAAIAIAESVIEKLEEGGRDA